MAGVSSSRTAIAARTTPISSRVAVSTGVDPTSSVGFGSDVAVSTGHAPSVRGSISAEVICTGTAYAPKLVAPSGTDGLVLTRTISPIGGVARRIVFRVGGSARA